MATAQLSHNPRTLKASKKTIFPSQITNERESLVMVKKLFATSISCITYLRGLFPESSYRDRYLDDLSLKILREDKKCPGSLHIIKCSSTSFESGAHSKDVKKACSLLIRQLYVLMQNLGPLPNDVILTMKLHYYNSVTPHDYQPPGFKEGVNSHFLLFEGEPVSLQMGSVSSDFHSMKLKVTTEATRMLDGENSVGQDDSTTGIAPQGIDCVSQDNGTTEIAHQGLDWDEEEEASSSQVQRMNFVHIEPSFESTRKKRKVSEPVTIFIPNRK